MCLLVTVREAEGLLAIPAQNGDKILLRVAAKECARELPHRWQTAWILHAIRVAALRASMTGTVVFAKRIVAVRAEDGQEVDRGAQMAVLANIKLHLSLSLSLSHTHTHTHTHSLTVFVM